MFNKSSRIAALALLPWIIGGCDGSRGPRGANGDDSSALPPTPTNLSKWEDPPGVELAIVSVSGAGRSDGTFKAGDRVTVRFTAQKDDGSAWSLSELANGAIVLSGPTFNYQLVIAEQDDLLTAAVANDDGSWSYTFATPIPASYQKPYNDTATFGALDGELAGQPLLAGTYTIGMWCRWEYTVDGESFADAGQTTADLLFGGATTIERREVVGEANCNQCHTDVQGHDGEIHTVALCVLCHTSGAEDNSGDHTSIDFRVMMHKIHDGVHLPSVQGVTTNADGSRKYDAPKVPYVLVDGEGDASDFSDVAFPVWPNLNTPMPRDFGYSALSSTNKTIEGTLLLGATQCSKCHGDPDGAGPLPAPAQGDLHRSQPSRRACGSCHDDVVWTLPYVANQLTMDPQTDDSACLGCHAPSGTPGFGMPLSTYEAHLHPLVDPTINPGVNFAITDITGGSGPGFNFQEGDKPVIEFTVTDDTGADIPLATLDATSTLLVGPTNNYRFVFPFATPNGVASGLPVDFVGRLASTSSTGKGLMGKAINATVNETLTVQFTSATGFTVTGTTSGALGSGALAATPSTNPSGSTLGTVLLGSAAVPQTIAVTFSSALDFTVTGSVSGAMGSGTMPASINASTRFVSTDGSLSFVVSSSTTPFANGNTVHMVVNQCDSGNPARFALVAGRTSFASGDRFYYDTVAAASTYTFALPMDLPTEYLGDGNGAGGQALVAGNLPVYFGRQTLQERTALAGAATTLAAAAGARDRYVDLAAIDGGLAAGDTAVLDDGVVGKEEYLLVGYVDTAAKRVWFRTPLRYDHTVGAGFQEATMTFRQEGATYTLDAATGTITSLGAGFGNGNAVVMSYRTDGAFGWYRAAGDTRQDVYVPVINDSPDLDPSWGDWSGLSFVDGTYRAAIWGRKNNPYGSQNEVQTYSGIGEASTADLLFGAATEIEPYEIISAGTNCDACHTMVGPFHGSNRRDFNTCVLCHGVAGAEDWPIYGTTPATKPTTGVTIDFRTMLHKIHMGEELTFASSYEVLGNSSSVNAYGEVVFPALPGRTMNCTKCHGTADNWRSPGNRQHPDQTTPTREWRSACSACHDSDAAGAHFDVMTAGGVESCAVCHGEGKELAIEIVHKAR